MDLTRTTRWRLQLGMISFIVAALGVSGTLLAQTRKPDVHRIVFQIDSDSDVPMKHAISNALNLIKYYQRKDKAVKIDFVTYGPGITMFRADKSPVRGILDYIHNRVPQISFFACGNTKSIIERREGHPLSFIAGTQIVPSGIVKIVSLEEAGWAYVRP